MKRELQRIEPWSAVRVGFFLGIPAGFLLGLLEAAFIKSLAGRPGVLPAEAGAMAEMSGGGIFIMALMMSLVCSLLFAFCGGLTAIFYNLIARMFGGIELQWRSEPQNAPMKNEQDDDEDEEDA